LRNGALSRAKKMGGNETGRRTLHANRPLDVIEPCMYVSAGGLVDASWWLENVHLRSGVAGPDPLKRASARTLLGGLEHMFRAVVGSS
jgi:hypothetical protein